MFKQVLLDSCYCSPIGHNPTEVRQSLKSGRSGIISLADWFPEEKEPFLHTGAVIQPAADFPDASDLHPRVSPRYARVLGGFCRALQQLAERAGQVDQLYLIHRQHFFSEWADPRVEFDEWEFVGRFLARSGLDIPASEVICLHAACSSGLVALNLALRELRRHPEKRILVVGLESELNHERFVSIKKLGALSAEKDPARSCMPFSRERSGLVPGEVMVAALVGSRRQEELEPGDIVLTAGVTNSDASRLTDCLESGEFLAQCLTGPLGQATGAVDFVCPHGTSTPLNDGVEGLVLDRVFGGAKTPMRVVPLKQYLGHTLNSSGLWEALLNVDFLRHNYLPPLLATDALEPFEQLQFVQTCQELPLSRALKVSVGFGGINSSVLIEKVT